MPMNGYQIAQPQVDNTGYAQIVSGAQSEAVQDILSKMPHWIVRSGTTILFCAIVLLFAGAYFIRFPDVIPAAIHISSSTAPIKIAAPSSTKITRLFVKDNQFVKRGEVVALLENTAAYEDVTRYKVMLNQLDTSLHLPQILKALSFNQHVQLGELQAGYTDLYQSVNQYLFFLDKNFAVKKVSQLQSQLSYHAQLNEELLSKDRMLQQQLMLEKKKFLIDSSLLKDKVIAALEFDNSRKELLSKQINAEATNASLIQNKLQQTEYLKAITDLQQEKLQQENSLQQQIRENVKRLLAECEQWCQRYLVSSPVEGKAVFYKPWAADHYIMAGEPLMVIVPPVQDYIANAKLPVYGSGKVSAGQKVVIKLSSYPYQEFGTLEGEVKEISPVALDTAYSIQIRLVSGLITSRGKQIPAQAELTGTAEVLTSEKSLLERLFETIRV